MKERVAQPRGGAGARGHGGDLPRVLRAGPARARPRPRASRSASAICDASDQLSAVKSAMRELRVHETTMHPSAVLARISLAKNRMETPESFLESGSGGRDQLVGSVWQRYREYLARTRALDFDDLLLETVRLLREHEDVRAHYREALPPRPRRRVPGHEPPAVRDRPRDRRRAPQRLRGGRRRPVDLRLARRRHPQDPRLPPRLRGRQGRPPADELPLDPAHPRRGQRRHPPQRLAPRQGARVGAGRGRRRALRAAEGRDVRGAVRGRGDRARSRSPAGPGRGTSPSSAAPRCSSGPSRRSCARPGCPTWWSAACRSSTARRCATSSPT